MGNSVAANPQNSTTNRKRRGLPKEAEPYKFQPGQSGNPGGRPKKKPITEIYERLLADGENVTAIEETVKTILRKSGMGAVLQLKEMAERTEGKVSQKVEVDGTLNISLAETIQKARKRAQQK